MPETLATVIIIPLNTTRAQNAKMVSAIFKAGRRQFTFKVTDAAVEATPLAKATGDNIKRFRDRLDVLVNRFKSGSVREETRKVEIK